jgi:Uma2 family endonuclease
MTIAAHLPLLTAAEFAELDEPAHGGKMELVRGKVVVMPPVGPERGEGTSEVSFSLGMFSKAHHLGRVRVETGYWLSSGPDDVRAPDVSFVSEARVRTERLIHGSVDQAPDLAVEIVSPTDRETDVADKVDLYLASGVFRVWVVRPAQKTVTVHRPNGDSHTYRLGDRLSSDDAGFAVEGFSLAVADLFGEG